MKRNNIKNISVILFFITTFFVSACGQNTSQAGKVKTPGRDSTNTKDSEKKYKVTFIELGSVRCIPCQQMQTVMKANQPVLFTTFVRISNSRIIIAGTNPWAK